MYDDNGLATESQTSYTYDYTTPLHTQPLKVTTDHSDKTQTISELTYPEDFSFTDFPYNLQADFSQGDQCLAGRDAEILSRQINYLSKSMEVDYHWDNLFLQCGEVESSYANLNAAIEPLKEIYLSDNYCPLFLYEKDVEERMAPPIGWTQTEAENYAIGRRDNGTYDAMCLESWDLGSSTEYMEGTTWSTFTGMVDYLDGAGGATPSPASGNPSMCNTFPTNTFDRYALWGGFQEMFVKWNVDYAVTTPLSQCLTIAPTCAMDAYYADRTTTIDLLTGPQAKEIGFMQQNNISTPVIEQVVTRKDEVGNEKILSATFTEYKLFGQNEDMVKPNKIYVTNEFPYSSHDKAALNVNYELTKDETKYELEGTIDAYDNNGNPTMITGKNGVTASNFYGYNGQLPVAQVVGARVSDEVMGNEASYLGFESNNEISADVSNDYWIFSSLGNHSVDAYTGKYSRELTTNGVTLNRLFRPDNSEGKYVFSVMAKSSLDNGTTPTGKISIEVYNPDQTELLSTISEDILYKNGNWVYVEAIVDLKLVHDQYELPLTEKLVLRTPVENSTAPNNVLLIDEVRLKPYHSIMTTYTYDPLIGVKTITDNNSKKSSFEYDGFNRFHLGKDQDDNIVQRVNYLYTTAASTDDGFDLNYTAVPGTGDYEVDFTASVTHQNIGALTFAWDFGDGETQEVVGSTTVSHTYPDLTTTYQVSLVVIEDGNEIDRVPAKRVTAKKAVASNPEHCEEISVIAAPATPFSLTIDASCSTTTNYNKMHLDWDFGDTNDADPGYYTKASTPQSHTYRVGDYGSKTVNLIVKINDINKCPSLQQTVELLPHP